MLLCNITGEVSFDYGVRWFSPGLYTEELLFSPFIIAGIWGMRSYFETM